MTTPAVSSQALGPIQVHTRLWRCGGQRYLTAIVKASYRITGGDAIEAQETPEISRKDQTDGSGPVASVRIAREDMPILPHCDVLLHAYAYPDSSGTQGRVQLTVTRGTTALIDKVALVYGNREAEGEAPAPFDQILLGYERAFGGIGSVDNPLGTGESAMTPQLPNIVHPDDPSGRAVGFGALMAAWPSRKKQRGSLTNQALNRAIVELPETFDWAYFQAAPSDQQLESIQSGDIVEIKGVQASGDSLRFAIPAVEARAKLTSPNAQEMFALRLDTVAIDAVQLGVNLLWRGHLALDAHLAAPQLLVLGAVKDRDAASDWPENIQLESAAPTAAAENDDDPSSSTDGTIVMAPESPPTAPPRKRQETEDLTNFTPPDAESLLPFRDGVFVPKKTSTARTAAAEMKERAEGRLDETIGFDPASLTGKRKRKPTLPFKKGAKQIEEEERAEQKRHEEARLEAEAAAAKQRAAEERLQREEEEEERRRLEAVQAKKEAEERREEEAREFRRRQAEAKEAERRKVEEELKRRNDAFDQMLGDSYGNLGRRRKS